jgi:hypothetical protein
MRSNNLLFAAAEMNKDNIFSRMGFIYMLGR